MTARKKLASFDFLLRCAVSALLVFTGAAKLGDQTLLLQKLLQLGIFPHAFSAIIAISLPWLEILLAVCLFLQGLVRSAALGVMALAVSFLFATGRAQALSLESYCGCFGSALEGRISGSAVMGLDVLLFACGVVIYRNARTDGCNAEKLKNSA
jgi:Na+/H+-translocating membrane pyrophosphatase